MPHYPPEFWYLAGFAVVFIGIAKAGFGGGAGMVGTPLIALAIPVTDAAALLLPLLIVCDVFAVCHYRGDFDRRSAKLLAAGSLVGIALGALFFRTFSDNERVLQMGLGVLAVGFVTFQVSRALLSGYLEARRPRAAEGVGMGVAAGFLSTLAHAGGPPVTMYLLPQRFERRIFVGTTVVFFAIVNLVKLVPYVGMSLLRVEHLTAIAVLSPLSYIGVRLGIALNQRFTDLWFNRIVYAILLLTGVQLIAGTNIVKALTG